MLETMPYAKKFAQIGGRKIAYVEQGQGHPIVLLHGNPASSFLWRNVIPELVDSGRVIVPDLIGHGDSEKLPVSDGPGRYRLEVAYQYVDGLLKAIGADRNVTLVIHDWGSAIGFMWAMRHPDAVRGVAYMEAIVAAWEWEDWPEEFAGIFRGMRSDKGEDIVLNRNMFVEAILPNAILRDLTETEMNEYRRPFPNPEDRQPLLNWPRQIPLGGEPAHIVKLVEEYGAFMARAPFPKLFVNGEPGAILIGKARESCRRWPNQQEVTVKGSHFLQEDAPGQIGQAVANWMAQTQ